MTDVKFKIRRYDPAAGGDGYFQEFTLEYQKGETVLDSLNRIKGEIDGSLTYRLSCRSAICGSCAMRICGHSRLACKTQIESLLAVYDEITVEPMENFPVIKDLVVDMAAFWEKLRKVAPYLQPDSSAPVPDKEQLQSPQQFDTVFEVATCIMCSACVSDCTAWEADDDFLGPAAMAKAFRFTGDSRDAAEKDRLVNLVKEHNVWDCVRCYECTQVCPKDVKPAEHIIKLREMALNNKLGDSVGGRHVMGFMESVGHSGQLDEAKLPRYTVKGLGAMISMAPTGIKMIMKGKLPLKHQPIPGVEDVRRIYKKLEGEK
jgi:succinate dehydrogenase / fumarate reductase iron-sulfur subunit